MKLNSMQQLSVLACSTGLMLAVMCALAWYTGAPSFDRWAMLLAAIGGFEAFFFAQDLRERRVQRG